MGIVLKHVPDSAIGSLHDRGDFLPIDDSFGYVERRERHSASDEH